MSGGICSVVKVKGYLLKPFSITRSVYEGCILSSPQHVLNLESLLRTLEETSLLKLDSGGQWWRARTTSLP